MVVNSARVNLKYIEMYDYLLFRLNEVLWNLWKASMKFKEDYIVGFRIMKCPACGGDLNIETDRDFLFCQFCGAKLMKDDQKIVIEHIERKIDEADIERQKNERFRLETEQAVNRKRRIISGILAAVGIIGMIITYSGDYSQVRMSLLMAEMIVLFIAMLLFTASFPDHKNKD